MKVVGAVAQSGGRKTPRPANTQHTCFSSQQGGRSFKAESRILIRTKWKTPSTLRAAAQCNVAERCCTRAKKTKHVTSDDHGAIKGPLRVFAQCVCKYASVCFQIITGRTCFSKHGERVDPLCRRIAAILISPPGLKAGGGRGEGGGPGRATDHQRGRFH